MTENLSSRIPTSLAELAPQLRRNGSPTTIPGHWQINRRSQNVQPEQPFA